MKTTLPSPRRAGHALGFEVERVDLQPFMSIAHADYPGVKKAARRRPGADPARITA
jgi:hypothetical protein